MKMHSLKIVQFSPAEYRLMELLKATNTPFSTIVCRLGEEFGKPYNEYIFDDDVFMRIRDYLKSQKQ